METAKASGTATAGPVVEIADRQRMLIQRMVKEALLIALGHAVETNLENLGSTTSLFADSHVGILNGAVWAGIPELTKMCTFQQMREVSYQWEQFKDLIDDDANEFNAMVGAGHLYVSDPGSCQPLTTSYPYSQLVCHN
jgi:succinylglutamate desuccinylase